MNRNKTAARRLSLKASFTFRKISVAACALLIGCLLLPNSSQAGTWVGGNDTWTQVNGTPWLSGVAPVAGEAINLTQSGGPFVITYLAGTDASSPVYGVLQIGNATSTSTLSVGGNGGTAGEETLLTGNFSVNSGGKVELNSGGKIGPGPNFASAYVNAGGLVEHTGGTWTTLNGDMAVSSNSGTEIAHYILNGADAFLNPRQVFIGQAQHGGATTGNAVFDMIEGTLTAYGNTINVGHATSGSGTLNVSGGTITVSQLQVFNSGLINLTDGEVRPSNFGIHGGLVDQTGGEVDTTFSVRVGDTVGASATYHLTDGDITAREIVVGANFGGGPITLGGKGTFIQDGGSITLDGNSSTPGLHISHTDATEISTFTFRDGTLQGTNNKFTVEKLGVFQGRGTVGITGAFTNFGRIIADGEGTDNTLDLTATGTMTTAENSTDKGWFAVNQGKLTLRGVNMTSITNWGEQSGDAQIDMVNSAQLTFSDLSGTGALNGSLLAVDRTDIPAAPENASFISVHDFSQNGSATFSSYDIEIRFDETLLSTDPEDIPGLYFDDGSGWVKLDAEFDFVNSLVTAQGLTSFGMFAVGTSFVPEPSTFVLLGLALTPIRRMRRRNR